MSRLRSGVDKKLSTQPRTQDFWGFTFIVSVDLGEAAKMVT